MILVVKLGADISPFRSDFQVSEASSLLGLHGFGIFLTMLKLPSWLRATLVIHLTLNKYHLEVKKIVVQPVVPQ